MTLAIDIIDGLVMNVMIYYQKPVEMAFLEILLSANVDGQFTHKYTYTYIYIHFIYIHTYYNI